MKKRVQLYVNATKQEAIDLSEKVKAELIQQGYEVVEDNPELIIGFGGDGTLLHLLREYDYSISASYIGVNCGTLGFLQYFNVTNVEEFVTKIPRYHSQKLSCIQIEINVAGNTYTYKALNEFVIQDNNDKTFRASVNVSGEFLENYVGSGMIFATPTGSTALNLSAGGSIVHPELKCIQITPREAIANSKMHCLAKSICIPSNYDIVLKPNGECNIKIYADGKRVYIGAFDSMSIYYRQDNITVLRDISDSFIKTIREKLI